VQKGLIHHQTYEQSPHQLPQWSRVSKLHLALQLNSSLLSFPSCNAQAINSCSPFNGIDFVLCGLVVSWSWIVFFFASWWF